MSAERDAWQAASDACNESDRRLDRARLTLSIEVEYWLDAGLDGPNEFTLSRWREMREVVRAAQVEYDQSYLDSQAAWTAFEPELNRMRDSIRKATPVLVVDLGPLGADSEGCYLERVS